MKMRKLLSFILTLTMVLILVPAFSVVAFADTTPDYLTFTAEEASSTVTFNWFYATDVQYSIGGTDEFQKYTAGTCITLTDVGDKVMFKGTNIETTDLKHFSMTGKIAASGDVGTLTDAKGGADVTLKNSCYRSMFRDCTSLTSAPDLPAKTLKKECYIQMFYYCTSLTSAPDLPATTLAQGCYLEMFNGCTSLTTAPTLAATTLGEYCYNRMFYHCSKLAVINGTPEDHTWAIPNSTYSISDMLVGTAEGNVTVSVPTEPSSVNYYKVTAAPASITFGSGTIHFATVQSAIDVAKSTSLITILTDVDLDAPLTISSSKTVNINLNGHVLNGNGNGSVIKNSGTLSIYDNADTNNQHYFKVDSNGLWVLNETLTTADYTFDAVNGLKRTSDNKASTDIPGENKVIKVSGGIITAGTGTSYTQSASTPGISKTGIYGGGIANLGTLTVAGGSIVGNSCEHGGGGIINMGTATIKDGCGIFGNTTKEYGGGVYNGGTFDAINSTISYNKADGGGGVYNTNTNNGKGMLTVSSSTISYNKAAGGGVYNNSGTVSVGGSTKIIKNVSKDGCTVDNLRLYPSTTLTINSGDGSTNGMEIGLNIRGKGYISGRFTTNGASSNVQCFTSDRLAYKVKYNEGTGTGGYLELINYNLSAVDSNSSAVALEMDDMTETQAIAIAQAQKSYTQLSGSTTIAYAKASDFDISKKYETITASNSLDWTTAAAITLDQMKADISNKDYFVIGKIKVAINPSVSIENWSYGGSSNTPSVTGNTGNAAVTYSYKVKGAADSTYLTAIPSAAGEYVVKAEIASTDIYAGASATSDFSISKQPLSVSGTTVSSKVYDGTTIAQAIVGNVDGIVGTDDVEVLIDVAEYDSASAGSDKTVAITYKLSGVAKANYTAPDDCQSIASISKRTVVLSSASASKQYDGTPLASSDVEVGGDGFAPGEGATYIVTGSQTEVGSSGNTFTYQLSEGTNPDNYAITTTFGSLTITENTTPTPTPQPPISYGDPDPVVTIPVSGDKDTVKVQATVSGINATIKNVTLEEIVKVGTGSNVVMDLSSLSKSVTGVTIPKETFQNIASSNARGLEIKMPNGTIAVFDKAALAAIASQANGNNIKLVIDRDDKAEKSMSAAQKKTLDEMNKPVVLDAYFVSNGQRISSFKGGEAEITAEYQTECPVRVWYVSDEGEKELVPSTFDGKTATFTVTHFSHYVVEQLEAPFIDVDKNAYYYDAVLWALGNGVTSGTDDTHFSPRKITNRAQMVTFLWRCAGKPQATSKNNPFTDVKEGSFYYEAVLWGVENGVVMGTTTTTFSPSQEVTRGQAMAFIARFAGVKDGAAGYTHGFTDVKSTSYYNNAIAWAAANGITSGKTADTFGPRDNCERAHVVSFLYNYFNK